MAMFSVGAAMVVAFLLLLRLGTPRADGTTRLIARNEHITSAYCVVMVALLMGGVAFIFGSLVG